MTHKIKKINTSLDELKKDASAIGLVSRPPVGVTSSHDRRMDRETYSDFKKDENNIIGRKDVVGKIVKALTDSNNSQGNDLSVLAIVGMGGLGKTTLAKSVYHDGKIEQHFQEKMWVCVSTPFEVNSILRGILESLKPEHAGVQAIDAICRILKKELNEKRYLLVLDDVWNEDTQKWEELIGCLVNVNNAQGSNILITTRRGGVATTVETLRRFDLEKLSDDECWLILKNRAIPAGSPPILEDQEKIGKEIAKKCGGVPLVAKVLGNMMRSQKLEGWQSVVKKAIWDLPEGEDRILAVLKLSFDELGSPSLKQCFAYCSVFMKDFEFERDDLIQHWMAQGWLHPSPNQNDQEMEDKGNEYFHILLQNTFFQDVKTGFFNRFKTTCKMHDLVHDLAIDVSKSKYLRSSIFDGAILGRNLHELKDLRVLNLYKTYIRELPNSIGKLKHLRYLNVMETKIKAIPKSLGQLFNLQTLKLPNKLQKFPIEIANLINLRHLCFGWSLEVPAGVLKRLTNLRSLSFVKIGKETGPQIGELGGLNNLKDILSIYNLKHVRDKEEAEKANLVEKKHVRELVLKWGLRRPSNSADNEEEVLEVLRPHSNLEFLEIHGFMGVKFPSWLMLSNNLKEIKLEGCNNCEEVPVLGRLPNLVHVRMWGMQKLRCLGYEFYGYDNVSDDPKVLFPALKTLWIEYMGNLIEWMEVPTERVTVFPCLEELRLIGCDQLRSAPSHFPSLKILMIQGMKSGGIPIASILSNSLTTLTSLSIVDVGGLDCLPRRLLENNLNLSHLKISECSELTCIAPPESHCCASLQQLTIVGCPKLRCLPVYGLLSLQIVRIQNCDILECVPIIREQGGLPSLQQLTIAGCPKLRCLPVYGLLSLQIVNIENCAILECVPIIREQGPSLTDLTISACPQLSSLPEGLQYCPSLEKLEILECPKLKSIPIPSEGLPSLSRLVLEQCPELSSLPSGLDRCTSLADLTITECPKVTSVPIGSLTTTLRDLTLSNIDETLPVLLAGFTSLRRLAIRKCQSSQIDLQFPVSLQELEISECPNLETGPSLDKLTSLRLLVICDCSRLTSLPSVSTRLKKLIIGPFWKELDAFPAFQVLPQLESLEIVGWPKLKSLPQQIQHLTTLKELWIHNFNGLEAIPEWLGNLASLETLRIWSCENLMYLPSVQAMHRLTKLDWLDTYQCPLLLERCREDSGPEWPKISHIPRSDFP